MPAAGWNVSSAFFPITATWPKHPDLSKHFNGREFILKELDNIEMIQAEFNAMIEEGMKMSMEDMEDMMEEMRQKMKEYKNGQKKDLFDEL